jgi:hypothetical protein
MSCFANLYPPKSPLKKEDLEGSKFLLTFDLLQLSQAQK